MQIFSDNFVFLLCFFVLHPDITHIILRILKSYIIFQINLLIWKKSSTFVVANEFTMEDNFAIQLFEGKKVRIVWDEEQEKYYFSVVDIVQVLTDSADTKQYIKKMRARDKELNSKWGTICTPVELRAFDGKHFIARIAV